MTYTDRKNVMSKKEIATQWLKRPRAESSNKVSEQRKELWHGINNFVMERNGAIVSLMYVSPIRIEVEPDSKLPERLRELGYDVIYRGEETRIGAGTPTRDRRGRVRPATGYEFRTCNCYELTLPR